MPQSQTSAQATFIDLATFAELEAFIYGGHTAVTQFVRAVQKSNWFSFIPVSLRLTTTHDFGTKTAACSINRSGDYVLYTWFRAVIPQVALQQLATPAVTQIAGNCQVRWTARLFHNIFEDVQLQFNQLVIHEFDNYWLDFKREFGLPSEKQVAYDNMIGNVNSFTAGAQLASGVASAVGRLCGTGGALNCIMPFFFSEDHGLALPVAALPFNDITIVVNYRPVSDLLIIDQGWTPLAAGALAAATLNNVVTVTSSPGVSPVTVSTAAPSFQNPEWFAMYAVVHNDERVKMGDAPRDMLIKQVQMAQTGAVKDMSVDTTFDLRFSHSVFAVYFAYRNKSITAEWSNYSTEPSGTVNGSPNIPLNATATFVTAYNNTFDPIARSELRYENTIRYAMDSDFYSLVAPIMFSDNAPQHVGYHVIPYTLHLQDNDPMGSTNYSKLANVSITHTPSRAGTLAAQTAAAPNGPQVPFTGSTDVNLGRQNGTAADQVAFPQSFSHICRVENWQIVRVAHGSVGLPVL